MPQFRITAPDGSVYNITGDNEQGAFDALQMYLGQQPASDQQDQSISADQMTDGLSDLSRLSRPAYDNNIAGAGQTWVEGAGNIPVVGPALRGASDFIGSNLYGAATGEDPARIRQQVGIRRKVRENQYPMSALSGEIAANIAPMAAGAAASPAIAEGLGMTGGLGTRAVNSAVSNAGISAADTLARGGDGYNAAANGIVSGMAGGAIPLVGEALSRGAGAIYNRFAPTVNAMLDPADEAARRVGVAYARDMDIDPRLMMNSTDEAVARANNLPIANVDRGGETTRALARSVSNQAPEARAAFNSLADDRFAAQGERASSFIRNLVTGSADDIGLHEAIIKASRVSNKPAYEAAYRSPNAQALFTTDIQDLMQSPTFRKAMADVPAKSADRAAVSGGKAIPNPFELDGAGNYGLRQNADGTVVSPNLEFWDHVQRNLREMQEKAFKGGSDYDGVTVRQLRDRLNGVLDQTVPEFSTARRGAAAFFGAEDALEAGKKFANSPRTVPEAQRAFASMKDAEKKAFQTGYASELVDKIRASSDRVNVINNVFKSPASRDSMALVFGPEKMKQIEAYVRVEDLADKLRGAMGNSTTARQLVELGLGAGGGAGVGYLFGGGDGAWKGATLGAGASIAKNAIGAASRSADTKTMIQVAKLLTSRDKNAINMTVQRASKTPAFMQAIEDLGRALAVPSRAGVLMAN
ncbi:hypothetical protein [Brucella sp. 22210]|uniref:hypothetical protein n=1 Tax=Brucella sp. 22210 TaxID=3453892 RepID=UPI003F82DED3